MDFQAAMETFAEAWVAANTPTVVNNESHEPETTKSSPSSEDLPPAMVKQSQIHLGKGMALTGSGNLLLPINMPGGAGAGISGPDGVKSMPIHCVVEQMTAPPGAGSPHQDLLHTTGNRQSSGTPSHSNKTSNNSNVELDTYAILPGTTLFSDLVRTALIKIGYTASEALGAKGAIQIKNWKPLTFDTITENPNCTLDDILGDLTSIATLRIRLCRRTGRQITLGISGEQMQQFRALGLDKEAVVLDNFQWTDEMVRCAVVDLLNEINQSTLAKLSPLAQSTISNIANAKYLARIGKEKCAEFGRWYHTYKASKFTDNRETGPPIIVSTPTLSKDKIRLTFHPLHELPKLREWYTNFSNPSDNMFQFFSKEMNEAAVRKERRKVSVRHLKIWWRNEKVRQKRLRERAERGEEMIKKRGRKKKRGADDCLQVVDDDMAGMDLSTDLTHSPCSPSSCQGHDTLHSEEEQITIDDGSLDRGVLSPCSTSPPGEDRAFMLAPYQGPVYPIPYQPPLGANSHNQPPPRSSSHHSHSHSSGHDPMHASIAQPGSIGVPSFSKHGYLSSLFLHSRDEEQKMGSPNLHHLPYHH